MIKVDPKDLESIRAFFEAHPYHTTYELAELVNRSSSTIRAWRYKCGLSNGTPISGNRIRRKLPSVTDPQIWDCKQWLYDMYHNHMYGIHSIAKIVNRSPSVISRRLRRYGISTRSHSESVESRHDCCSEQWLMEHYADRPSYEAWCTENNIEPEPDGGREWSLLKCSEKAQVVPYTIYKWLLKFNIGTRDHYEALAGHRNPFYGKTHSDETKAIIREKSKKIRGVSNSESSTGSG
jgi:predicted transcriptional regulator